MGNFPIETLQGALNGITEEPLKYHKHLPLPPEYPSLQIPDSILGS